MDTKPTRYLTAICLWQASEHLSWPELYYFVRAGRKCSKDSHLTEPEHMIDKYSKECYSQALACPPQEKPVDKCYLFMMLPEFL